MENIGDGSNEDTTNSTRNPATTGTWLVCWVVEYGGSPAAGH